MADPGAQSADVGGPADARDRRTTVVIAVVIAVVVLAPFVALLVWSLTTRVWSTGDVALTEIAVRDVGGVHTPLLGAYSRYGWHHPGPLYFMALAVPYRLLGSDGSALAAGAVVVNTVAAAAASWLLWRRGGRGGLVVGGLVVAILVCSLGGDALAWPWNPVGTVLPMLAFVLAVWSVTCGDAWMLPVVVVAGSFVVQTHVGTAGVVLAGLAAALVAVWHSRRARAGDRRLWLVSLAVGGVLWILPIVDAVRHRGGNARALADFWTASHGPIVGWSHAARIVGAEFALDAPWITGRLPHPAFTAGVDPGWTFPAVAVVFAIALVVASRRPRSDAARLGWITVGFTVVAWVSVARIVDEPFEYLVRWTELVGVTAWLTIGWVALELVRATDRARIGRVLGVSAVAATVVVATIACWRAFDTDAVRLGEDRVYVRLDPQLAQLAPALRGPVVVRAAADLNSAGLASSVLAGLVAHGVDARFPRSLAWQVGRAHALAGEPARTQLLVAYGDPSGPLATDGRNRVLASVDELSPSQRAELERLRSSFSGFAAQVRWTERHPGLARRLEALTSHSARGVVVERR